MIERDIERVRERKREIVREVVRERERSGGGTCFMSLFAPDNE